MEDRRDALAVIVAGYTDEMETFLLTNPGLESRFRRKIHFPDYTIPELLQIFDAQLVQRGLQCDEKVRNVVEEYFRQRLAGSDSVGGKQFANAREVRNLLEAAEENMALRVKSSSVRAGKEALQMLVTADLPTDLT